MMDLKKDLKDIEVLPPTIMKKFFDPISTDGFNEYLDLKERDDGIIFTSVKGDYMEPSL